jgi:hypothetical protein
MLKFSKTISSKSKKYCEARIIVNMKEYIYHLLKWIFQNELIIQQAYVEMAKQATMVYSIVNLNIIIFAYHLLP